MSYRPIRGRADKNQSEIVAALKKAGCSVEDCSGLARGAPDLLVGRRGHTYLLEVKTEDGELNELQKKWHANWKGKKPIIVKTPGEALVAVGAILFKGLVNI